MAGNQLVVAGIWWAHPDRGARQLENFCTCRAESKVQNMVKCSEISVLWADGYIRMRDAGTQKWLPPAFPTQRTLPALPVRLTPCWFPHCWKLEGNCWL